MAQPPSGGSPQQPSGPQGWPQRPEGQPERPPYPHSYQGAQRPGTPYGGYGAGYAAEYPASTGPSAPKQNRGCAVAAIAALTVAALLLVAGGVWGIIWLSSVNGEYQAAPDCSVGQTPTLEDLVPDHETEMDQPIAGLSEEWREGNECRWVTPDEGTDVPSAVRLALVHNADHSGGEGEDEAAGALRAASEDHSPSPLNDLGDEAFSWYETEAEFGWGCVGVRMSNLFTVSCYTAAVDFQASESIPEEEAVAGAEELARDIVQQIEGGDF